MAKNPKRPRDPNQLAQMIVGIATGEIEDVDPNEGKDPAAQTMGRKGGTAAAKTMTPEQLKARARKAAESRWKK